MDFKELGFKSEKEFHAMVCDVDLTDVSTMIRFKFWQRRDGSKSFLLKLLSPKNQSKYLG